MGAVRWLWAGAAAVAVLAVAVVLLVARGNGSGAAPATGTEASFDRIAVDFGDPVTATVSVSAPRGATVRVRSDLSPLTQLGRTRVTRVASGGRRTVTYATRASCLDERCIARRGTKRIALRPATVSVDGKTSTASWPPLEVVPRVSPAAAAEARPPLRSDASPPSITYRTSPHRLATILTVAAALLAVAGVLLAAATAASLYRRRRETPPLTGLERALALARDAESRPAPDRRRALGLLARHLGSRDTRLADEADELAWSAPAPPPAALADLISEVEEKVNGR